MDSQAKANKIAHLAEAAARVPEEKREAYIAENAAKGKISVSGFVKEAKQEEKRKEQLEAIANFEPPSGKFRFSPNSELFALSVPIAKFLALVGRNPRSKSVHISLVRQ